VPKNGSDPLFFDSKHLFMPCTLVKALDSITDEPVTPGKSDAPVSMAPIAGPTLVKTSDGALHKIHDSTKLIRLLDAEGLDDVLHLSSISEAALLHTLRTRYRRDAIYTAAGQILISINPYRKMSQLYSEETMTAYRNSGYRNMAPHLFVTADRAYSALTDSIRTRFRKDDEEGEDHRDRILNQSIVISGESGAGKVRRCNSSRSSIRMA
jgi:myosin heavy subunit